MKLEKRVPKYFTYQQVAEILNIPICEVRELAAEGKLVPKRFVTRWRFAEETLLEFIRQNP